jgi:hypothetical protein
MVDLALAHALDGEAAESLAARSHASDCESCGAQLRFLRALGASLEHERAEVPSLPSDLLARTRSRAVRALRAQETPRGVGRELVAALALAMLALPLVVGHAYLVIEGAAWLLSQWVPAPVLTWLAGVYVASLALGVGALYGLIPLAVAWRRRSTTEAA